MQCTCSDIFRCLQSPSQSKAIQDKLRKREELREKFKEDKLTESVMPCYKYCHYIGNVLFSEDLGIVHRGIQVGESKVRYKVNYCDYRRLS